MPSWRLGTKFRLKVIDTEEKRYYRTVNLCEEVATEASALVRTAFQLIYEVLGFAESKLYADNIIQGKGSL